MNPARVNVFEEWESEAALAAHFLDPAYTGMRDHIGQFGMSNALQIARRLKLPKDLLRRARKYLKRRQGKTAEMTRLQELREEAEKARLYAVQKFAGDVVEMAENLRRGLDLLPPAEEGEAEIVGKMRGGFEGVDYLIYGTITSISAVNKSNMADTMLRGLLGGSRNQGAECFNTKVRMEADIRITDTNSGEVRYATRISQEQESATVCGGGSQIDSAGLLVFINDVHSLGLANTAGLQLADSWYWNQDDASRKFAKRFFEKYKRMPSSLQAANYSAATQYLNAVKAAGTTDADKVMTTLKGMKIDDFYNKGQIRADGRMIHDMYLFQVKSSKESTTPWDYYKMVAKVPGEQAFTTVADSKCALLKK